MAYILKPDGSSLPVDPKNGKDFSLEECQAAVGGYIEALRSSDGKKMLIINEEGKLCDLPFNPQATILYGRGEDYIVGTVLVCDPSQFL